MYIEKLASLIRNNVIGGLTGYRSNLALNIKLLEDEIVSCRLNLIKKYALKGLLSIKDLLMEIDCVLIDCQSLERCGCQINTNATKLRHFEIPQIVTDIGKQAIEYIGSTDKQNKFLITSSLTEFKNIKYRKRGGSRPIVWINHAPNSSGMLDCYLINSPFIKNISISAVFKDPRQLNKYACCQNYDELMGSDVNMSALDKEIVDTVTKEKLYYYRQTAPLQSPNNQQYNTGD